MTLQYNDRRPSPKDSPLERESDGTLLAGHWAPAGTYQETETRRLVRLEEPGPLPASFNGRVACYVRLQTWAMMTEQS